MEWPEDTPVIQVRIARQTDKLKELVKFYCEGLGLRQIGNFENHNGYDGVMIGLPSVDYHLEFISHREGSPGKAPNNESLLVLYFEKMSIVEKLANKLNNMGYQVVEPENPFWKNISKTIADPDRWRIVQVSNAEYSNSAS